MGAPRRRAFLTAEWRYLVMLNYRVDQELLLPLVPAGTTLDLWQGNALASVVGFRFLHTRVLGLAAPYHRHFDEVNLRFYVTHITETGEVRRGVTFVRELVPREAIARLARLIYNEPYSAVPMRSVAPASPTESPGRVAYEWQMGGRWEHVAATAAGPARIQPSNSEATFITEHYWGYTRQRDGGTVEYEVAHPQWRVWNGTAPELVARIPELYGEQFAAPLAHPPTSCFVAEGSAVTVFRPRRLAR